MATHFSWNGDRIAAAIRAEMGRRIRAACLYLSNAVKADISQAGTLRYTAGVTKKGNIRQRTIYNFTHSRPGNPPFKQTGHLRRSITWEVVGLVGRVGTNLLYGRWLELGTRFMEARPFLRSNLMVHMLTIRTIIAGKMKPGDLPGIESNQSRSGHFGVGARQAGYE